MNEEKVKEIQDRFKKELSGLLKKYNSEISIEDFGRDWAVNYKIVVDFNGVYDKSEEENYPYSQLILGTYID